MKSISIRKLLLLGMALALCLALAACSKTEEPAPPSEPDPVSEPESSEPQTPDAGESDVPPDPENSDVNDPDVAVDPVGEPEAPTNPAGEVAGEPPVNVVELEPGPEDPQINPEDVTGAGPIERPANHVPGHVYSFTVTGNVRDGEHKLTFAVIIEDSASTTATELSIGAVAEKVAANFDADVNICNFFAADADPATDAPFATVELKKGGTPDVTSFTAP